MLRAECKFAWSVFVIMFIQCMLSSFQSILTYILLLLILSMLIIRTMTMSLARIKFPKRPVQVQELLLQQFHHQLPSPSCSQLLGRAVIMNFPERYATLLMPALPLHQRLPSYRVTTNNVARVRFRTGVNPLLLSLPRSFVT